jgi:hypothetical protein
VTAARIGSPDGWSRRRGTADRAQIPLAPAPPRYSWRTPSTAGKTREAAVCAAVPCVSRRAYVCGGYGPDANADLTLARLAETATYTPVTRGPGWRRRLPVLPRGGRGAANRHQPRSRATSASAPPNQQNEQALCLAIVVNAIIAWNTIDIQRVLEQLLAAGELITSSESERISPLAHQHIHLYGHYRFDLGTRPADHRPLRAQAAATTPAEKTLNRV